MAVTLAPPTGVSPATPATRARDQEPIWAFRAALLWRRRRWLARRMTAAVLAGIVLVLAIPKLYTSTTSIMPPDPQGSGAMLLAALAGQSGGLGALGSLASGLLGGRASSALYVGLLQSATVRGQLLDQFHLRQVYHKRYRVDAIKRLAHRTQITQDKKNGIITIAVADRSPQRARDLARAYTDALNQLIIRTDNSAAHRERVFIEKRLNAVRAGLESAEIELSRFSSQSSAVNLTEQTRALVDAGARVQAELLVEQSGLESLRQIYGDGNVRIRESEARIASLQAELRKMAGSAAPPDGSSTAENDAGNLVPPLRQLPRLAVPYADLYRRVKVQETIFALLTQRYEIARIEEAKDVPVVRVIDPAGVPEKKSFPPRLLLLLLLTLLSFAALSALILLREGWQNLAPEDPRRLLAAEITPVLRRWSRLPCRNREGTTS